MGEGVRLNKKGVKNQLKTYFKEEYINEGLINSVVQLLGKYCSFG